MNKKLAAMNNSSSSSHEDIVQFELIITFGVKGKVAVTADGM